MQMGFDSHSAITVTKKQYLLATLRPYHALVTNGKIPRISVSLEDLYVKNKKVEVPTLSLAITITVCLEIASLRSFKTNGCIFTQLLFVKICE